MGIIFWVVYASIFSPAEQEQEQETRRTNKDKQETKMVHRKIRSFNYMYKKLMKLVTNQ